MKKIFFIAVTASAVLSTTLGFAEVRIFGNASDMTISGPPAQTLYNEMRNVRPQQSRTGIRMKLSRDIACADKYVDPKSRRVVSEYRCVIPIKDIKNGIVK